MHGNGWRIGRKGSHEKREFALLTQAIVDFAISQEVEASIEIPPAFIEFLSSRARLAATPYRSWATKRRSPFLGRIVLSVKPSPQARGV
jgi:hypothetical protein